MTGRRVSGRHGGRPLPLAVGLIALLAAGGCTRASAARPDPDTIVVALPISPNNLDPRLGTDEASQRVHALLYRSLVRLDDRLRVVPDLATGWETPDALTYRVHLRRDVRFHDGRALTSADVVHTFGSFLDPAFVSGKKGAYRLVASVTADDPWTVTFRLEEPFDAATIEIDEARRLALYREAQERIARAVPYISLWYKTNVAVAHPSLRGVTLSPIADFSFLKDVWRAADAPTDR